MSLDVTLEIEVDTGGSEPHTVELYEDNITHNLHKMAGEAGICEHLWHPDRIGVSTAGQLIGPLRSARDLLQADPERFEAFNPANGWGTYDGLLKFVVDYLAACEAHPKATIRSW